MTLIHSISLTELSIGHHRIRYFNENCWGHACRLRTSLFQALRWWGRCGRLGKTRNRKVREKGVFSCSHFLNARGPDYLGAWNRLTAPHRSRTISCTVTLHSESFSPQDPENHTLFGGTYPFGTKKSARPPLGRVLTLLSLVNGRCISYLCFLGQVNFIFEWPKCEVYLSDREVEWKKDSFARYSDIPFSC